MPGRPKGQWSPNRYADTLLPHEFVASPSTEGMEARMNGTTHGTHRALVALTLIAAIGIAGSLAACDDDDITGPVGAVTAVRDQSFNFSALHTFAMPDTVVQFAALTGTPIAPSRQYDQV